MVSLRDYQQDVVDRVRSSLIVNRRVVMEAPPGAGKTRMAKHIIDAKLRSEVKACQTGRVLFAVHRRGLVENASDSFSEDPVLKHGVIMSGNETNFNHKLQVASIDTLNSWWLDGSYKGYTFDLVVFDECHSHCGKLQTFLKYHDEKRTEEGNKEAFVIGLSATPQGTAVSDVFKDIVSGPDPAWLIENKYLKSFRYFNGKKGQLEKLIKQGDRFTNDSINLAMDGLNGDLVRDWKKHAQGRATIGFFNSRQQAKEAKILLLQSGVRADYVDGETPDENRRTLYKLLNNGDIDYLCNVGVIERGTDIPRVGCVQLCTAIGSIVRYRQMVGRGSRWHDLFHDCIVLDHGGNVDRHGFFEDQIQWSLTRNVSETKEATERPTIECPSCGRKYRGGRCMECDYEPTARERKKQGLDFDGAELKEIKEVKEKKPLSNEEIMIQALYAAGRSNRTFKQALAIAYSKARERNVKFQVPRFVEVGGRRHEIIPYGSPDQNRRVKHVYPWTCRK